MMFFKGLIVHTLRMLTTIMNSFFFPAKSIVWSLHNMTAVLLPTRMQHAPGHVLFQNKNGGSGKREKTCLLSFIKLLLQSFIMYNKPSYFILLHRRSPSSTSFANSYTKLRILQLETRRNGLYQPLQTRQTV